MSEMLAGYAYIELCASDEMRWVDSSVDLRVNVFPHPNLLLILNLYSSFHYPWHTSNSYFACLEYLVNVRTCEPERMEMWLQSLRAKSLSKLICYKSWQAVQIWAEKLLKSNMEFQWCSHSESRYFKRKFKRNIAGRFPPWEHWHLIWLCLWVLLCIWCMKRVLLESQRSQMCDIGT